MQELLEEARRCLKCKNPRCQKHCPILTSVPEVITLFEEGRLDEAGYVLFENNPLSAVCAIVCPHEDQCKGNCVRGIKGEPVSFCDIEKMLSERYLKALHFKEVPFNGRQIAVVGSGPAGITAALLLAQKGYKMTLFELHEKIGGVLTYGIPEFRLSRDFVKEYERLLKELGVTIKTSTLVGPVITVDKLLADGYEAIFIGTGVWNPKTLNIKGETLSHVNYAINYLKQPMDYALGKKVCVIGAGNVAMDAARCAKYYGAEEVTVCYRRSEADMTATKAEIHEARAEGVAFAFYKSPVEIVKEGVVFEKTKKVTLDDGTVKLQSTGEQSLFKCDSVIIAVSQMPKTNIVAHTTGLETHRGLIATAADGSTSREGIFACGDVVSGAKTVIDAVAAAKIVVQTIDAYCKNH